MNWSRGVYLECLSMQFMIAAYSCEGKRLGAGFRLVSAVNGE
jgi:hypothetical protein